MDRERYCSDCNFDGWYFGKPYSCAKIDSCKLEQNKKKGILYYQDIARKNRNNLIFTAVPTPFLLILAFLFPMSITITPNIFDIYLWIYIIILMGLGTCIAFTIIFLAHKTNIYKKCHEKKHLKLTDW